MLTVGVLGAGHLGKIHIKCLKQIEQINILGFYDQDPGVSRQVEAEYGIKAFASVEELIDRVDVVDIVTPTLSHFDCASRAMKSAKHVF
ncbi:MAG TPA: Gfo/Idh/MocA family oxidoreductase, partial [Bacteroidales bacterium]|nr:Gfo/Idh/MocA family oxidoreductase [Bacteroidales bacterium]